MDRVASIRLGFPPGFVQVAQLFARRDAVTIDNAANKVIGRLAVPPSYPAAIVLIHVRDKPGVCRELPCVFAEGPIALGEFQERAEARADFVVHCLAPWRYIRCERNAGGAVYCR
jgi:hypothetical protein